MKSHTIPQLIIRRFSETINVFDLKTGKILEGKRPNKILYEEGKYTDEVEDALNKKLEVHFATLLKKKLLQDEITVDRADLFLIKKYMFVTSIRTLEPSFFRNLLLSLENNAQRYYNIMHAIHPEISKLPKTKDNKLSDYDLFNNALAALVDFDYKDVYGIYNLFNDKRLTLEMAAYATSFFASYVAFWDAPNNAEFLLSDAGIISEYEGVHQITGGIDISKLSYMVHQINKKNKESTLYGEIMANNDVMYECYDLFNISSTRCIVAINPFFRLYSKPKFMIGTNIMTLPIPDIWPAVIQNKELFKMPTNEKFFDLIYLKEDQFTYKPKILNNTEMMYINDLLYKQSHAAIGFNDPKKVYPSLNYCLNSDAHYLSAKTNHDTEEQVFASYVSNIHEHKLNKLLDWCETKGCRLDFDPEPIFCELTDNIYLDFKSNYYIYEYLLNRYEETFNNSALDFLGQGNKQKKMEFLVAQYNLLKSQRGDKE